MFGELKVQLKTNHSSSNCPKYVRRINIRPVKNGLKGHKTFAQSKKRKNDRTKIKKVMARNTHNPLGYKQKQITSKHSKNKLNRLRAISDLKDVIPDIICEGRVFQTDGGESASRSEQKLQIDVFVLITSCRFYFQFNIRLLPLTTTAVQCSHVSWPEGCHVTSLILFLVAMSTRSFPV